jgi:hypothetical protein
MAVARDPSALGTGRGVEVTTARWRTGTTGSRPGNLDPSSTTIAAGTCTSVLPHPPGRPSHQKGNTMSSSRQSGPTLAGYLAKNGFTPAPGHPTWHDCPTTGGVIRVVCDEETETYLIALTPYVACRYQAMFHVGMPDAVIIAAVKAALRLEPGRLGRLAPAAPGAGRPPRTGPGGECPRKAGQ